MFNQHATWEGSPDMGKENKRRFWVDELKSRKWWPDPFVLKGELGHFVPRIFLWVCVSIIFGLLCKEGYADDSTPTHGELKPKPVSAIRVNTENLMPMATVEKDEEPRGEHVDSIKASFSGGSYPSRRRKRPSEPKTDSPTDLKVVAGNGMAYLTWDAMPRAIDYSVYISEDGKKFKQRVFSTNRKNKVTMLNSTSKCNT